MNKETILIKNYVLSTDVLYLDYRNIKEDSYNRFNYKQTNINKTKVLITKNDENNGSSFYK